MNHPLAYCLPILIYIKPFLVHQPEGEITLDFREGVTALFIQFERDAISHGISVQTIEHIKYALAALVDECVLYSSWSEKVTWMQRSLQLQFFGEHRAGEGFFERLSQLRQAGHIEIDALEIYALCLQCGFQGIYRFRDHTQFVALKAGLESQIAAIRGPVSIALSADLIPHDLNNISHDKPLWWIFAVALMIIFFMWMGYCRAEITQLHHAVMTLQQADAYDR